MKADEYHLMGPVLAAEKRTADRKEWALQWIRAAKDSGSPCICEHERILSFGSLIPVAVRVEFRSDCEVHRWMA